MKKTTKMYTVKVMSTITNTIIKTEKFKNIREAHQEAKLLREMMNENYRIICE